MTSDATLPVPPRFPFLPTGPDGVQTLHLYNAPARLEPLPMGFPIGLDAWAPFVERWHDPENKLDALPDLLVNTSPGQQALGTALTPLTAQEHTTPMLMRQEIAVALLLEKGMKPQAEDLVNAARGGNPRLVHRLIQARPALIEDLVRQGDVASLSDSPLLVVASRNERTGFPTIAQLLLDAGMSPDHKDQVQGRSALHWAAAGQNTAVLWVLLKQGANPNVHNRLQHTPMHYAAARNRPDAIRLLMEHGADPRVDTGGLRMDRRPPLLGFEAPRLDEPTLRDELSRYNRKEPPLAPYRNTPLLQAAIHGSDEALDLLLTLGEEPFPLIDPSRPDGPRDDRVLRLVDDARRRAVGEGEPAVVVSSDACRTLLERHQLRHLFVDNPDLEPSINARPRPRL